MHKLLNIKSKFSVIVQQYLIPLEKLGHYLENIKVCNFDTKRKLVTSFASIFDSALSIIKNDDIDSTGRQIGIKLLIINLILYMSLYFNSIF
jgi:hypothetical protein